MQRDDPYWDEPRCPACGNPIDYCQGHGRIGDPVGLAIVTDHHENGIHTRCNPAGCLYAAGLATTTEDPRPPEMRL